MGAAAKHVSAVNDQVKALLNSLRSEVATAPAHFKGDASATFTRLMAQYDKDALALSSALQGISEQLLASARDYAVRDEEQAAEIVRAGSGLNMT